MPREIEITDDDIEYAEQKLFCSFDDERRSFIRDLSTLDLQAVPGSGKTTVLLAKLLVFEKFLPLENDAGILVISHTNAAVDEIRSKIQEYCPQTLEWSEE